MSPRFLPPLFAVLAFFLSNASGANLLVNGDFETGDLTGWTNSTTLATVGTPALDGSSSLVHSGGGTFSNFITQTVASPITGSVVFSMLFSSADAVSTARTMNFYISSSSGGRANVRLVDLDDDGDGEIQVFDNAGSAPDNWNTVLSDLNVFSGTHSITVNFTGVGSGTGGDGIMFTVDVDGNTSAPIQAFQNSLPGSINRVELISHAGAWTADNVSLIPEPSSAIFLLSLLGLFASRRRR